MVKAGSSTTGNVNLLELELLRPPEWCSGLRHCIAVLEVSLQTLVRSQAVSQLAVTRSPIGRRTIGPASFEFDLGPLLGSSRSSDSLWRAGCLQADLGCQLNSGFQVMRVGVKKRGLVGHVSEGA
jgi:hypothetical protein